MKTDGIVLAIDAEIARLQQAKALLAGEPGGRKPGRPAKKASLSKATSFSPAGFAKKTPARRTLSPEAREKIAAAQRARWAKSKKTAK
jgi:hypothetical protein